MIIGKYKKFKLSGIFEASKKIFSGDKNY